MRFKWRTYSDKGATRSKGVAVIRYIDGGKEKVRSKLTVVKLCATRIETSRIPFPNLTQFGNHC
jgi:hypothetical protein